MMEADAAKLKEVPAEPKEGATGYVALIGRPNTGKSTFLNTVLHRHLAAVSSKPQTTRKHLLGILTDDDSQILFLDTPGIHQAKLALDASMDRSILRVLEDSDVVMCLADPTRKPGEEDVLAAERAKAARKPTIVVLNKCDLAAPEQIAEMTESYRVHFPKAPFFRMTALEEDSCSPVVSYLKTLLPRGPFLYAEDEITDVYEREIAQEFIRETLLEQLRQEVPHCIAVQVDRWQEKESRISIGATLYIERAGHKAIVIGRGGERIRRIRQVSAGKIREFCGKHVELSLFVKLREDWRDNKSFLNEIGLK